ncbi:CTP synthase [Starmerella bacillaris]|uniref:CTP synthase n=1 Tax=Starmerella bacillaris TaxID=1247836 RepID=A0AAV5RID5_STABA|nr:CTP synthase [Starmerella bacillaris]
MKYVVVSGGVISGIGKGVIASSVGLLFKSHGYRVTSIKIDPYMNIDAGTMSPLEHGEVFVLKDGGEADLDLGNYERYLNVTLTRDHNLTTGKIYKHVIEKERRGDYLGKTVQIVPHLTNAIQDWLETVSKIPVDGSDESPEICIIELGGTVGDIESMPFVEALRQFQFRVGADNFALVHVSLVPVIHGELKTKPTQAAIRELRSLGLTPDIIACRCTEKLSRAIMEKISMFCHVGPDQVLGVHDVSSTYHVPVMLEELKLMSYFSQRLHLDKVTPERQAIGERLFTRWKALTMVHDQSSQSVTIALVGKYVDLQDSYISVVKALEHSALRCGRKLVIRWVDSEILGDQDGNNAGTTKAAFHEAWANLCTSDGILVPGGFGTRGIHGMILAAQWARENKVPYLGICLGFQIAVIEYARNVLNNKNATSEEFLPEVKDEDKYILYMPEVDKSQMGGTMRLGEREARFTGAPSKLQKLYNSDVVLERHRHRYEVNPDKISGLEEAGLKFVSKDDSGERMEVFEVDNLPYYVGCQYHPEYLSRVLDPSKPILGLVAAASGKLDEITEAQDELEAEF